jgi:DNA-binding IclR family transcriptional regulator
LTAEARSFTRAEFEIAKEQRSRSSPAVRRVAAILNFMAAHPSQAFTLTELIRALKLSRATCHALLTGLVEVGFLYRASDKQYVLGPAMVSIARQAAEHASPLLVAQPEMRALADEFDALCAASFREDHDVVVAEHAASVSNLDGALPRGSRLKLHPVPGAIFFAWSPQEEVDAWLDACQPRPTVSERTRMQAVIAFTREHGFSVHVNSPEAAPAPDGLAADEARNFPIALLAKLDPETPYDLASITAPVFDGDGKVALALSLSRLPPPTTGAEIERTGRRLRQACDRLSEYIAGRQPPLARSAS